MTLLLDLNTEQQQKIKELHLEYPLKNKRKNMVKSNELSNDELFEARSKELDTKIAFDKKIRSFLTKEQYVLWKNYRMRSHKRKWQHQRARG